MNSEDKFKERLRSKIESKEFPFEEEHWKEAAAYIDKQRRGGKWRLIALLLFLGGAISLLLLIPSSSVENIIAETELAQKESRPFTSPQTETISQKNSEAVKDTEKLSPETQKPEKLSTSEPLPDYSTKQEAREKNTIGHPGVPDKTQAEITAIDVPREEVPETIITERPQLAVSMTRKASEEKNTEELTERKEDFSAASMETLSSEYPGTETQTVAISANVVNNNNGEHKVPLSQNRSLQKSMLADSLQAAEVPEEENEVPPVAENENNELAAVKQPIPEKTSDTLRPAAKTPNYLILEAGTDLLSGWNDAGQRDAAGLNPVAGAHYFSPVSSRFNMSFGIQYRRTGHLGGFTHHSKSARYSFGEESDVTEITPRNLHYLGVPIRLYFDADGNNTLGVAYSIYYLLDVESQVYTYNNTLSGRSNERTYSTRGYTDGFRLFDSQVSLFYRRTLYKNIGAHAELFFGIDDVKDNGFFGSATAERNMGLRIMLFYNLTRN